MEMMMDLAKFELHQQQHLSHSTLRIGGDNHPRLIPHKKKKKKKLLLSTNVKLVIDFPSLSHSQFSISRRQTRTYAQKNRVPTLWVVPESKEYAVEFQNNDALLEIDGEKDLVKEAGVGKKNIAMMCLLNTVFGWWKKYMKIAEGLLLAVKDFLLRR